MFWVKNFDFGQLVRGPQQSEGVLDISMYVIPR